ncbi:Putative transcriptional regulator, GntR family [Mycobacteroides abscessus subsp. bolletii]|uniref:GntR family transcriptional regulator n=1 Tax=Mycobacteroides abscessus TaxID=36809 RepID=UPI000926E3ED|nr:GntR family transcriptional regulator [Mycobacteroides abscessus]SHQ60772.1 Putative transcriptional regulator, GntR family [Mycobacteroides abscessus subsp. bolletii]SHS44469.1 Putative transcriptional regulator, GntR family [Mycobacteroides abscessus subsp. bolletii]SHT10218.1 Putative transcriptional regulator, GntR family [Mycobacteroides abscessus subsp. bolletii]SHT11177.1 Putative transcriptional regulator, GntR family [Mycobacteroides abscessus subsp. bolletii]SHY14746.1 Putative tr
MPVPPSEGIAARSLLRDNAYKALRTAIVDGTLAPGERLRDDELSRWLGVSRTPIREALARLEQAGVVQTQPGRHTIVSPIDVREARAAQSVAAAMHELAVREAITNISPGDLATMRHANTRFAAALDAHDPDAALAADDEFHAVAVEASANPYIAAVLEQVTPVLRRLERIRFASRDGRHSVALHEQIIARCEAGDSEGAGRAARDNWHTLIAAPEGAAHEERGAG